MAKQNALFQKINIFVKRITKDPRKEWRMIVGILGGIVIVFLIIIFALSQKSVEKFEFAGKVLDVISLSDKKDDRCEYTRVIDGVCVDNKNKISPRIFGVMFDNHPDARPHTNLAKASVVYEAPVEGNFTRFMGLFPFDIDINKVGPIRSARPYFVDWIGEYGEPFYVHVGGSPEALALIRERDIFDFDEFGKGWYFWRDQKRFAPHNAYTSSEQLQNALENYEKSSTSTYGSWKFTEHAICEDNCIRQIDITFSVPSFVVRWTFNSSTNKYERFQSGIRHKDSDGDEILADTVIIQMVDMTTIDAVGRKRIDTIGEGDVKIFVQGKIIEGTWKKESIEDKTKWFDKNGDEIALQPGNIWIEVVANFMDVVWK